MPRSMWEPLKEPIFRALWIASLASNIGSWMQDIATAWLMTSLSQLPVMTALLQTAAYLPFFMLSMPSGALADVVDRRQLLILGQVGMLLAALSLGLLTVFGIMNPWVLLFLTFMLGIGAATSAPAWNAVTPDMVPRPQLEAAIALGSVGYNVARGIGAALGGVMVAKSGPGAVFLLNAVSFLGVVIVLVSWKHKPDNGTARGERILGAIRAGMRFARNSPPLKAVLARSAIFALCSSAMWALIPLVGRRHLDLDCVGYGLLLSVFGVGTLLGAFCMPKLRRIYSLDQVNATGLFLFALAMAIIAYAKHFAFAGLAMVIAGVAWVIANATLNAGAQMSVPSWVRARALAIYILVFQGSVAIGSALWGALATASGLSIPLIVSPMCLGLGLLAVQRYKLGQAEKLDTTLSMHWQDPQIVHEPHPDKGPVLVTVEYRIDPNKAKEFADAMSALSVQRRRDGAFQWHLFCDLAEPSRYVETFLIESWGEHVRQHERAIVADREAEERVNAFKLPGSSTKVHHLLSAYAMDSAEVQEDNNLSAVSLDHSMS